MRIGRFVGFLVFVVCVLLTSHPRAHAAARCFVETNQCIDGRVAEFWAQNGGLAVFGFPIGAQEQITIDGQIRTVQRFQRNRIELHPDNARPYDVLLGRLGADRLAQQGRDWYGFAKGADTGGCRVFAETGHAVCGDILTAWRSNGIQLDTKKSISEAESLALFGLPLSGLQLETQADGTKYQVQWFERARFELHPENTPPYHVLLGLLGNEEYAFRTKPAPTAVPVAPASPAATAVPAPTAVSFAVTPEQLITRLRDMPMGYWATDGNGFTFAAGGIRYHREIYYYAASTGKKLVRMSINVRNNRGYGGDSIYLNPWRFTLVDVEGRQYTYDVATYALTDAVGVGYIGAGQQGGGDIVFEIPKDTSPASMLFVYNSTERPVRLIFDNNVHQ